MPFAEWSTMFTPTDGPASRSRPTSCRWRSRCSSIGPAQGASGSAASTARTGDSTITAIPLQGPVGRAPRRRRDLLGGGVKVTLWGTRGSRRARTGHRPLRRQHVVRRARSAARIAVWCSTRARVCAVLGHALAPGGAPRRRPADAPPHGPHPGSRFLRAAVPSATSRCTSGGRAPRRPTSGRA